MIDAHAQSGEAVLNSLGVAPHIGLSEDEVRRRRHECGPNRLREAARQSLWIILGAQFTGIIVWLLAAAAALSLYLGDLTEGTAILAVLAINATIGFVTELRAVRSMEALRRLAAAGAKVRRGGQTLLIPAEDIVPGDIVLLEGGDVVPADLRLIESANLQCDESTLTGESVPVAKSLDIVKPEALVADRSNMVFKGTAITRGTGLGVAVATGMATELGNIAALAEAAKGEVSPLEKRLARLGGQLVWVTLLLAAVIAATGVARGQDLLQMVKTAVALAVAAVPEGLPIVATIALARGMWRMARRNALIERLSAVETLGATTVILTDKTGTLTENRMTVVRLRLEDGDARFERDHEQDRSVIVLGGERIEPWAGTPLHTALRIGVLCNNASLSETPQGDHGLKGVGDPMEIALLRAGMAAGIDRTDAVREAPEVREEAFGPDTNMMATVHRVEGGYLVAVKGAPEAVIGHSTRLLTPAGVTSLDADGRARWNRLNDAMASEGLRVLALAMKEAESDLEDPYAGLTLIGLVGLLDPPRPDVAEAIAAARAAGVRVVMLTGDHARTARAIAAEVGLAEDHAIVVEASEIKELDHISEEQRRHFLDAAVFARVSPETKLALVSLYQQSGEIVAMTGDGVNDAPALKKADIGIAMGQRGTDVAREAAAMVLRDDAFPSIVAAMHQGRVIFDNIRKVVVYLMSCNLSEILVIGVATLSGLPLPLLPLQILYLNLVTDVFPAFALAVGEGDPDVMKRPPRDPREPILARRHWLSVAGSGALLTVATLGAFILALETFGMSDHAALTISFLTLAFSQLWHVFDMRRPSAPLFGNEISRNPFVWGALALCILLIAAAIHVPVLSEVMGMVPPDRTGWALAIGASLMPLAANQMASAAIRLWRRTG